MDAVGAVVPVKSSLHLSVRHLLGLGDHADHIHAEAVDPLLAPPGHHVKDFLPYLRVVPV